jgi:TPR repeat protein
VDPETPRIVGVGQTSRRLNCSCAAVHAQPLYIREFHADTSYGRVGTDWPGPGGTSRVSWQCHGEPRCFATALQQLRQQPASATQTFTAFAPRTSLLNANGAPSQALVAGRVADVAMLSRLLSGAWAPVRRSAVPCRQCVRQATPQRGAHSQHLAYRRHLVAPTVALTPWPCRTTTVPRTTPPFSRHYSSARPDPEPFHDADPDASAAEALLNALEDSPPAGETAAARARRHGDVVARAFPLARAACDRGSPRGATLLGYLYRDGLGVAADAEAARGLLTRAAEAGDPFAQLGIGTMIYEGLVKHPGNVGGEHEWASPVAAAGAGSGGGRFAESGREIVVEMNESGAPMARFNMSDGLKDVGAPETPADIVRRVRKARRKAGYSDQEAMAFEQQKQQEVREDFLSLRAEVVMWFRKASDQGNDAAAVALANIILREDTSAAVALYERAAKGSHVPSAHFNLAQLYYAGLNGVAKDEKLALKHFSMAAHLGDASAQFFVGHLYRVGEMGVEIDLAACLQYVQLAAAQGHAAAMYYLALMHRNGEGGLEVSRGMFRKYVEASGELGHGEALACLADMYYKGTDGVRVNYEKALSLYQKAGRAGEAEALCSAAAMVYHGFGTKAQKHKAFLLYQEAAVAGSSAALHNIGSMYFAGDGVPKSDSMAEHFFRLVEERQKAEKEQALSLHAKGGLKVQAKPRAMPHTNDEKGRVVHEPHSH